MYLDFFHIQSIKSWGHSLQVVHQVDPAEYEAPKKKVGLLVFSPTFTHTR